MSAPATGAARDQVARLLPLVPYLHGREQVPLDEAAARLGVPAEQLRKDLKVLLDVRAARGLPRRPDRRRPRRARGRPTASSASPTPTTSPGRCA